MRLSEIQTKGQFHQKLLSPVLNKVVEGLDEFEEILYGIGWDVDYNVAPDGKSVSVRCENHDYNASTEWVMRWRIYDGSFLPDLGEEDIEIEMVHYDDDIILFNVNIISDHP